MTVHALHHVNIRAPMHELVALRDFYTNVVGLAVGPRPPFRSKGFWLYAGNVHLVHLTAASDEESLPEAAHRRSAFDHVALRCSNLEEALARLREHGVAYTVDTVPETDE